MTLAIASSMADFAAMEGSFTAGHPFRKVLVAAYKTALEALPNGEVRNYSSPRGSVEATFFHAPCCVCLAHKCASKGSRPLHMATGLKGTR